MVQAESLTVTLAYTYSAAGLRVAQSVGSSESVFSWDWASGVPEMLSDGASVYLVAHDTLGVWDGVTWAYHLPDALGSVRQAVDGAGGVASSREWTPFGVELGVGQAGLGYTGEWWDVSVGLQYLRARWYDGQVGRFTRRDVWPGNQQQPLTMNPYLYALANPVLLGDPSGYGLIENIQDLVGKLAVLWYRDMYPGSITRYSHEFSISGVELEAGLYTMGGGEGFVSDVLRVYKGFRQDIAWRNLALWMYFSSYGCKPEDYYYSLLLEKLANRAAVPSLGIAQVDPPDAAAIEAYWDRKEGLDLSPPDDVSREYWLTLPDVGIRYLAAYIGWSRRELESFSDETGGTIVLHQLQEWFFIGKMINGDNPEDRVQDVIDILELEGRPAAVAYWNRTYAWLGDNKMKTGTRFVKYMKSPLPSHMKLSDLPLMHW
ncbi:MAG: RHS repeat-associated core domain-containing protein [Chloroflexota bacterium]|nr:RHS repeat-associated core domain-containing protein [Chloroflexota bacterium]